MLPRGGGGNGGGGEGGGGVGGGGGEKRGGHGGGGENPAPPPPHPEAVKKALATKADLVNGKVPPEQLPPGGAGSSIEVIDALDSDRTDAALSAAQGKVLKTMVDSVPQVEIVDDLTTGGTNKVLSAEQGKVLKANIDRLDSDIPKYSITGFDAQNEPTGFSIVGGASYTIVRSSDGKLQRITSDDKTWTAQYDTQGRFTGLS